MDKYKMTRILLTFISIIISMAATAQSGTQVVKTIKGRIINEATNEPVAYTNIGIEDTFHGTASDDEGNFQLKIPGEMASRQIFFSSVGFQSMKLPVENLFNKEFNIIKLMPQTYDIEKVDVEGRSMVLARILRMASENTPYNYISGPFNLTGNMSVERITGNEQPENKQAELIIYDKTGYRTPSKTDAYKMRAYKVSQQEPDYSFSQSLLNIDEMLELDWVRNASSVLNPSLINTFELELKDEPVIDGKHAWVITFHQENPTFEGSQDFHAIAFKGEITILKADYSVKKIEAAVQSERHNRNGKSLAVGNYNSNYLDDVSYDFKVSYANLKPESFLMNKVYQFKGKSVKERISLEIDNVNVEDVQEITFRDYFAE